MASAPPSLKSRALRLLAAREHSRAELERRLGGPETEAAELTRVLDDLQAKGFINEQRVLESLVHRHAGRLGSLRMRHTLQGKGLAPEAIAGAMETLAATELERAREVWRKKFGNAPAMDVAGRARQMRFLASRGFAAEVVRRVVNSPDED
ncbi:MAG: recombination regulator RecX [Pseudomonadota bacterium]